MAGRNGITQESVIEANRKLYNRLGERYRTGPESHVRSRLKQADIKARLAQAVELLGGRGVVALDGGAGDGYVTATLSELVDQVVAVDVSEVMVERLRAQNLPNVEVHRHDLVGFLTEHPAAYDLITLCSVVHHFLDYRSLLLTCGRALRPGGLLWTYNDPVGDGDSPDGAFRAIHLLETASLHLREPRRMAVKIGRRLRKQRGASDLEQLAECQNYPSSGLLAGVLDTLPEAGLEVVGIDRLVSARLDWARRLKARFSAFRSDYALLCRRSRGGGGG